MSISNMPAVGTKSSPRYISHAEKIPEKRSSRSADVKSASTKPTPIARPRSRFFTPKKYLIFVPTILAIIFLICTIYLLATRNKAATTNAPKIANISLSDLSNTTLGFYSDKIKTEANDTTYALTVNTVDNPAKNPLSVSLANDNSGITIDVNWTIAKDFYDINLIRGGAETFELKTDIPIADFTILNTASHANDTIILLMADGTVEYVPISSSLQNRAFYSHGKIKDLENVVKFYHASTGTKDTILVQKTSGELVDIGELL